MFLQPKKNKYKKIKKGKLPKWDFKKNKLKFGTVGLKAVNSAVISARQIEASRQAISRKIKKKGKIWIRIFPDFPITSKPISSRMGKGKGSLSHWGVKVKSGTILFEICGVKDNKIVEAALKTGSAKLPIKTKMLKF
jgi:large subunit ribosomal protein L16